jgi:uncharacterized protein (UPF0335 family)
MSRIGHNSVSGIAADRLASLVERIEGLETEIKALNDDKKDVYAEAKGNGFDVPAMKALIQERRQDPERRDEKSALLDLYRRALENSSPRARARGTPSEGKPKTAAPYDPATGEIHEPDEHPAGSVETTPPADDAERRLVTEAPLESGAGAAESPSEGGRPVNSSARPTDGEGAETTGGSLPVEVAPEIPGEAAADAGPHEQAGEGSESAPAENSETEASPSPASAGEGAGDVALVSPIGTPAPSTDDDDWVIDKETGERRPWCPDRDMPACLRRSA